MARCAGAHPFPALSDSPPSKRTYARRQLALCVHTMSHVAMQTPSSSNEMPFALRTTHVKLCTCGADTVYFRRVQLQDRNHCQVVWFRHWSELLTGTEFAQMAMNACNRHAHRTESPNPKQLQKQMLLQSQTLIKKCITHKMFKIEQIGLSYIKNYNGTNFWANTFFKNVQIQSVT